MLLISVSQCTFCDPNLKTLTHHTAASPFTNSPIMMNNLTASASASTTADRHVNPPSSFRKLVDRYCIKPVPPPTGPAVIPRLGVVPCSLCKLPAGVDGPPTVVICDACERVFHHACAKLTRGRYAARIEEWLCGPCYDVRLEITLQQAANESDGELQDQRNHNVGDSSSSSQVACSNLHDVAIEYAKAIDAEIRREEGGHSGALVAFSNLHNVTVEDATVGGNIQKATDAKIKRKEGGHSHPEKSSAKKRKQKLSFKLNPGRIFCV